MGLFRKKPTTPTPEDFYVKCCKELHDLVSPHKIAAQGVILVPELIQAGEKTVLALLKDPFFQMELRDNPQQYYYVINMLSFMSGVVFADKWHHDFSAFKNGFVDEVIQNSPMDYATPILENVLGFSDDNVDAFYVLIFQKWLELHKPFWALQDPRNYTYKLMLASYQLGVSAVLEKYGFK